MSGWPPPCKRSFDDLIGAGEPSDLIRDANVLHDSLLDAAALSASDKLLSSDDTHPPLDLPVVVRKRTVAEPQTAARPVGGYGQSNLITAVMRLYRSPHGGRAAGGL
jgi:hypothetical protein